MLAIIAVLLGFSFPLTLDRNVVQNRPAFERATLRATRRAPLAEHGWEENVLSNLTSSEPSWE
tara:strand:- start:23 stop:211 length:189 start_codon:yes stop_codon:yes gene_type:complete